MTKRITQFSAPNINIPTGSLKTIEEIKNQKNEMPANQTIDNPLASFLRKSKVQLVLPSKGKWYPNDSIIFDNDGSIPVFAMTASDDVKLRTGDATMSGKNIYDVIHSCIPNIVRPEDIPHIDIDTILLAIRIASYGPKFDFVVNVPNTTLTKTLSLDGAQLLHQMANIKNTWDEEIIIQDETGKSLQLELHPISLKHLFSASKTIFNIKKSLTKNFDQNEEIKDETGFLNNINSLTTNAIDLLCSSIRKLMVKDSKNNILFSLTADNPQDEFKIKQTVHQLDIAYFNAIREHIDTQRQKYIFQSAEQISSTKETEAGAPEKWTTELTFMGSNFLPETKTLTSTI